MGTTAAVERVFNFSAGPAALPLPVLEQIQSELLALPGAGASILEISHRSSHFLEIMDATVDRLRRLLNVPENYQILFLQGGSRLQFSMVPMNLLRGSNRVADYLLTGSWGRKAIEEARKEGPVRVLWDGKDTNYDRLPADPLHVADDSAYVHFTSNETIQGVQFSDDSHLFSTTSGPANWICDASSDFLSRPLPIEKYGLIYACAQKNAGPAGVTLVIIRDDLLAHSSDELPGYLNYREHADARSLYNTPPTFGVYAMNLVVKWLLEEMGGLAGVAEVNQAKATRLYDVIDSSSEFYLPHAAKDARSMMNVTFRLPSTSLEQQFLEESRQNGLHQLKGHRSVGGIRASVYNAMPSEGVEALRQFMLDFRDRHAS